MDNFSRSNTHTTTTMTNNQDNDTTSTTITTDTNEEELEPSCYDISCSLSEEYLPEYDLDAENTLSDILDH